MTLNDIKSRLRFVGVDHSVFMDSDIYECEGCGSVFFISNYEPPTHHIQRYVYAKNTDNWRDCEVCGDLPDTIEEA